MEKLKAHQFRRLSAMVAHAYAKVPFYRQHFDRHQFRPSDLRSLADLPRIPPLEKRQLRETPTAELLAAGVAPSTCQVVSTSGSSGMPLRIHLDAAGQRWQRISAWRILFDHGFRWTDRTLEIRMVAAPVHPVQRAGIAPKTWLSLLDPPSAWVRTLIAERPAVVMAGASTLAALARECPPLDYAPRMVISDSETLYPGDRQLIRERLGTDPINVYGLVELSNFAWECEERKGFHISADSHLVEIVEGELVVTDLGLECMPVIRYRTGDCATWSDTPCACGRTLPVLREIQGRALDSVLLPSGRTLFWPFFHEVLGRFPALRKWRVIQSSPEAIRLQLETDPTAAIDMVRAVEAELREPLTIRTEVVARIALEPGEKFRAVVRRENQP